VRVRVRPDGSLFAIGADPADGCRPVIVQADGVTADFGPARSVTDAWFRDPRSSTKVGVPNREQAAPCGKTDVVDLAVSDTGAVALCADGRLRTTTQGESWETTATVRDAVAVARDGGDRTVLVRSAAEGCPGLAVADLADAKTTLGCVETDLPKAGRLAFAVTREAGWMLVGDRTYRAQGSLDDWARQ